ncbi:MAG: hypothetical protein NZ750_10850 [Anaerolineae bacterium]|nr:hypothetical protein [Anaerolineae bacterium]MDW8171561.1 hypothetical protein [Anaerolineae bacterium]
MDKHLLLVTYTVYEGDDSDLVDRLEKADSYEIDETSWLIWTEESPRWWYSQLEPLIYEEDELMVLKISLLDFYSDEGVYEDLENWLKQRGAR